MDSWEETTGQRRNLADSQGLGDNSSQPSLLEREIADLQAKLRRPTREEAAEELLRCLRLVAIAGMSDTDRHEWLVVAYDEIKSIPICELADRCAYARKVADHPSKIIPAIFAAKIESWRNERWYRERLNTVLAQHANQSAKRLTADNVNSYCTPEEAKKILADFGMTSAFAGDKRPPRELRQPTPEELAKIADDFKREHYS
jgi:hypothetical protein